MNSLAAPNSLIEVVGDGPMVDAFVEELLIEEARQRARSRQIRRVVVVLALALGVVTASWAFGGGGGGPSRASDASRGRPVAAPTLGSRVNSTSLGIGTTVNATDMLSSSLGYAIISNDVFHPTTRVYLAVTHSGGVRWSFVSALPVAAYRSGGWEYIPTFHFVSPTTGYVTSALSTGIFVTTDAGVTWRRAPLPGPLSGWTFGASTMAAVSRVCPAHSASATCPAFVSFFSHGSPTAQTPAPVPLVPGLDVQTVVPLALTPSHRLIVMEGLQGGGGLHGSGALLATSDLGSTWRRIGDPCGIEAEGDQLVVLTSRRWLLSCFLGEGMNQGKSSIWRTADGGLTWSLVNRSNDSSTTTSNVGDGGGVSMAVTPSRDGSLLFGAMQGAIGGVEVSRDGGIHWSPAFLDGLGGSPETLSTFGARGALVDVDGGLIYRTTTGRAWSALPLLPAGRYEGLPICQAASVTAVLGTRHIKGSPGTYPVVFTNRGPSACYLTGAPIAQPVAGSPATAVGLPANRNVDFATHVVALRGDGGTASLWLSIDLGTTRALGYPPPVCHPRRVTAVSLRFSPPSAFVVALPAGRGEVCSAAPSSFVGFVVAGSKAMATTSN